MSTSSTGPHRCAASTCTGFSAPKVTVAAAVTAGPSTVPVSGSTPLGESTASTGTEPASATRDQLGGRGAQRPAAGEADDAVEHEVRPSDRRGAVGPGGDGPAARPAQRRQPAGVRPLRVEQHRGDPDAAAAQLRAGPQGVAAVVARSHEERDAMSVRRGQHPPGDDGEAERGAAHEGARRDPRQHGPLGGAYLLDGEDLAHPATLGRREGHRDGDVIGVWSTWMSNLTSVPCTLVTVTVTP